MIRRTDLQKLAQTRRLEAETLFHAGLYDGSLYLCGYVIELALRACVCRTLDLPSYPDDEKGARQVFRTHDFELLVLLSGLRNRVTTLRATSATFNQNWALVTNWQPEDRYLVARSRQDASEMLNAIKDPQEGVYSWLLQQW